jgi:hypothetical protein
VVRLALRQRCARVPPRSAQTEYVQRRE